MNHICLDGKILPADKPVLMADNRGYRYGDGLFETMKMIRGQIVLDKYHFERLFHGLAVLKFKTPSSFNRKKLLSDISLLSKKNHCGALGRIRLSVFRGNGGLHDKNQTLQYLIECTALDESVNRINKKGYVTGIYPDAQKNCTVFSNLKSANYLIYVMASQFAKEKKLDECIVCNERGHVADATITNIFLIKKNLIITPALTEGGVSGVMRRYLLEKLASSKFEVREGVVTKNDMESFDEVFLTNAVQGIRWVERFRDKTYANIQTLRIFREFVAPLYGDAH